jgi:hypothetical protein
LQATLLLISNLIASKTQDRQHSALLHYSCKPLCSFISDLIASKIQLRQHWALRQHTREQRSFSFKLIAIKIQAI